jgi:hypothetical protein
MITLTRSHVSISRIVHTPIQNAWDLLTDTRKWHHWGPTVIAAESSERYISKGSKGRVQIPGGNWLQFVVTEYEHCHYWNWRVASVKATGHRVESLDADNCRITFALPIFGAPYVIVCWIALRRMAYMLEN